MCVLTVAASFVACSTEKNVHEYLTLSRGGSHKDIF
jgi:hypothetical protein